MKAVGCFLVVLYLSCFCSTSSDKSNVRLQKRSIDVNGIVQWNSEPHHLSLEHNGRHICGASIISSNFALTTASCTNGYRSSALTLRSGSSIIQSASQTYDVQQTYPHHNYDENSMDYDYSLVSTQSPFQPNSALKLIRDNLVLPVGTTFQALGWQPYQNTMQSFQFPLQTIQIEVCRWAYSVFGPISQRSFCGNEGRYCDATPGSPVIIQGIQYGIVSYGNQFPCVYSRVSNVRPWIRQIAGI